MMASSQHLYEVRPRKDKRGVDLISDALPFGRLWYGGPNAVSNAVGYAEHFSRSHDAVIRVYDEAGNVTDTHEHAGEFKESGDVPTLLHYVAGLLKAAVPPLVPLEANWGRRAGFASLNI